MEDSDLIERSTHKGSSGNVRYFPLTPMQAGMLYNNISRNGSGVDIEQLVFTLHEDIDTACLLRAWRFVTGQHHALRASFLWEGFAEPTQIFHETVNIDLYETDCRDLSSQDQDARIATYLTDDRCRCFDLTQAPLQRLACFRMAAERHVVVWTFHHIILDGRAFLIVIRQVFAAYEAMRRGSTPALRTSDGYPRFLEFISQLDIASSEAFWKGNLGDFTTPTHLFVDREANRQAADQVMTPPQYIEREVRLSETLTCTLCSLAQKSDVTVNNLVQAAWAILLSRYSLEEDVVFGVTRACRHSTIPGAEDTVGLFMNTVPMRIRVGASSQIMNLLQTLRSSQVALRSVEHTPLVKAHAWSGVPRNVPLFDTLVAFENYSLNHVLRASGDEWQRRDFRVLERTGLPLTLNAILGPELVLRISADERRYDEGVVDRMLGHVLTLLDGIAADPHKLVSELPMVTDAERQHAMRQSFRAKGIYATDKCIHQLFEDQVVRSPDAIAVEFEDRKFSYRELNEYANRVAHRLLDLGVKPDTLVAICMERSLEMVVGLLGILKAGGAYVPLDPAYPEERLAFMLTDTNAQVLLSQRALCERIPMHSTQVLCLDETDANILPPRVENPECVANPSNLAYVIYTSGSTGKPKGVMIEHRQVVRLFLQTEEWFKFGNDDVWTMFHSSAFDFSVWEIWGALVYGGRLIVISYNMSRSPERFLDCLCNQRVTVLNQTPSAFQELARVAVDAPATLSLSLRHVIFGGEALELQSLRPWFNRFGDQRPRLVNMYGITETTVHVTYRPITLHDVESGTGSVIGQPIPDLTLYVLDRARNPCPIGVPGEIYVGGEGLARGYLNQPDMTADRFIPDPFNSQSGHRLYRTGDLARYLQDGDIEYLGRIDLQVKIRGFRIELGEIESVLGQHRWVRQNIVIAREDSPGDKRLVAYMVGIDGQPAPGIDEVRSHLRQKLPEHMIPSAFVILASMPLTTNGKIDRKALPAPDQLRPDLGSYIAPRNSVEAGLAKIYCELLKIDRVGSRDNFFELGGHSLLAMRAISAIRRDFHVELPVWTLFAHPCIDELSAIIAKDRGLTDLQTDLVSSDVPSGGNIAPLPGWKKADVLSTERMQALSCDVPEGGARATGVRAVYRFLAMSDHWLARTTRWLRRAGQQFSVPAPRVVVIPLLWVFLAARTAYFFIKRVLVCEPLFKAYCTKYGARLHTGVFIHWIQGVGDIILGDDVAFDGKCSITFAARFVKRPTLIVGDGSAFGHNCTLTIGKQITIGRNCRIAGGTWMFDSSGHPVDPEARKAGKPPTADEVLPIVVGDNVWIGQYSTVMPGVTIGENSVVAAHSVVMTDVPPNTVVAGNPARTVSRIGKRRQ